MDPPPRLYVRPESRVFTSESALRGQLEALTRDTLVAELDSPGDLRLDRAGTTRDGYRFTSAGLKQVCALAAAGLFLLVRDVSGAERDPESAREEFDFDRAIRVYNRAVELRAPRFDGGYRLLKNLKEKLIEGVLGPKYALIENSEVLDMAGEAAAGRPGGLRFHSASLAGRRLMLRYVADETLFSVPGRAGDGADRYRDGLHFANSEVGGESAFRAAVLLHRVRDDSFAMDLFLGGRRIHAGRKLQEKLARLFGEAAASTQDAAYLRKRMLRLQATSLGAGVSTVDGRQSLAARISARLRDADVPLKAADRVAALVLHGSPAVMPPTFALRHPGATSCTQYDVFTTLTGQGCAFSATAQEAVERAAYALLAGRLKLG